MTTTRTFATHGDRRARHLGPLFAAAPGPRRAAAARTLMHLLPDTGTIQALRARASDLELHPDVLLAELDLLAGEIERRLLSLGRHSAGDLARRLELLSEIGRLRGEIVEHRALLAFEQRSRIHAALDRLRDATPSELILAAPEILCSVCGFSRAVVSSVAGSRLLPRAAATRVTGSRGKAWVRAVLALGEIRLDSTMLEADLLRRRRVGLAHDAASGPAPTPALAAAAGFTSCVIAPIVPSDRCIGLIHADRLGDPAPNVDLDDESALWRFAEQFGLIFERAILIERLAEQRAQLSRALAGAGAVIGELGEAEVALRRSRPSVAPATNAPTASRPAVLPTAGESALGRLSAREQEVLRLMAAGATNGRIATQLVISPTTVKSHVHQILRKLGAANRAEAVARYLQLSLRTPPER